MTQADLVVLEAGGWDAALTRAADLRDQRAGSPQTIAVRFNLGRQCTLREVRARDERHSAVGHQRLRVQRAAPGGPLVVRPMPDPHMFEFNERSQLVEAERARAVLGGLEDHVDLHTSVGGGLERSEHLRDFGRGKADDGQAALRVGDHAREHAGG